ncbi:MAG TPA: 4Fe-4S binding protein, partial [Deltaproteobacteria bacterium]|nr:4Fe-4S binding protein [Deltaproteobacteria bacterium]
GMEEIEIIGELKPLSDFKLPPLSGDAVHRNAASQALIHDRTHVRPHVEQELCTGCGSCIDQCPASALSMNDGLPAVNAEACVTCFCCQEICPQKAIALR